MVNFVGFDRGPHSGAALAVNSTLRSQFPFARVFRDGPIVEGSEQLSNILFFASEKEFQFSIPPHATFETEECERTAGEFQHWEIFTDAPMQPVITDARNPLARLQAPITAAHYEGMNQLLPPAVWIR